MNEIIEKDNIVVEDLIYEVRGKQVMLDSDLARLYECKKWHQNNKFISKTTY